MDLTVLTDEELRNHQNEIITEQERRRALLDIPLQMEEMQERFLRIGGKPEDLPERPFPEEPITQE